MIAAEVISAGRALVLAHGPQDQAAKQLRNFVLTRDPSAIVDTFTSLLGSAEATVSVHALLSCRNWILNGTANDLTFKFQSYQ